MHREGTQILGITTLQLLLLTVTLPWTSLQFLHLDTLPSLKFNMANLTTYFITRLVSDQRAAKDYKNLNKKVAYPLFKDGHVQENKTCIHQHITAICIPEMKKTLQYHIKLILEKASGDICHAQCRCPTKLPAHPSVAALLWTRVIKFTRDWSLFLPVFQLNAAYFRGLQYPLSGLVPSLQKATWLRIHAIRAYSSSAYPRAVMCLQLPLGPSPAGHPHSAGQISPYAFSSNQFYRVFFISGIHIAVM